MATLATMAFVALSLKRDVWEVHDLLMISERICRRLLRSLIALMESPSTKTSFGGMLLETLAPLTSVKAASRVVKRN